jgi:hypothetical protein
MRPSSNLVVSKICVIMLATLVDEVRASSLASNMSRVARWRLSSRERNSSDRMAALRGPRMSCTMSWTKLSLSRCKPAS